MFSKLKTFFPIKQLHQPFSYSKLSYKKTDSFFFSTKKSKRQGSRTKNGSDRFMGSWKWFKFHLLDIDFPYLDALQKLINKQRELNEHVFFYKQIPGEFLNRFGVFYPLFFATLLAHDTENEWVENGKLLSKSNQSLRNLQNAWTHLCELLSFSQNFPCWNFKRRKKCWKCNISCEKMTKQY